MPPREGSPQEATAAPELGQQKDPDPPPTRDTKSRGASLLPCTRVSSPEPGCCPGQGVWETHVHSHSPSGCGGWRGRTPGGHMSPLGWQAA